MSIAEFIFLVLAFLILFFFIASLKKIPFLIQRAFSLRGEKNWRKW